MAAISSRAGPVVMLFMTFVAPAVAESPGPTPRDMTPERCASSFRARLTDARAAITAHQKFREAGRRALAWWGEHCHPVSESEDEANRQDDATSFACDTQRGRPPGLTPAKIREYMSDRDIASFQKRAQESQACVSLDPISLDVSGLDTDVMLSDQQEAAPDEPRADSVKALRTRYHVYARIVEVRCFQETSRACEESERQLDELRKKLETMEAERTSAPQR